MAICALEECNNVFEMSAHNKLFCNSDCTRIATNRKILQKYHDGKRPMAKGRSCGNQKCRAVLNSFNRDKYCNPCKEEMGLI